MCSLTDIKIFPQEGKDKSRENKGVLSSDFKSSQPTTLPQYSTAIFELQT